MSEQFQSMTLEQKVSYLIENLKSLPNELVEEGIDVLAKAGETEYAVVLARDRGMIDRAISILIEAGDYLWAALISRNAGRPEQSERIYRDGLKYYIDREMFGRAISAASALGLPAEEIDSLYLRGIEAESRGIDLNHTREMLECAMQSLEISLIGRDDELSLQLMKAIQEERERGPRGHKN
ncbi:MAG TPA: hypothetical protein PLQ01_03095 [Methanothrix sp.]|nr:hypothetical protein [Methanothrix sp.]